MLNYEVDPRLLDKYVPSGTVLDSFLGKTYVSLVGFRFCRTKLFGSFAVPLHSDFDEVNLRFYVRRKEGDENRRGVVFIAEIVPKQAVATTARLIYGENYVCLPMKHHICAEGSKKTAKLSMAGQESVVPADCTSDRHSRASARGKSGTIYYRALLGLFHSTKRRLSRISRFS